MVSPWKSPLGGITRSSPMATSTIPRTTQPRSARAVRHLLTDRRFYLLCLGALLLLALATRLLRCSEGLPYLHRYGEPNLASRSLNMLKTGDLNPHWFNYGSLTIYLHAAVDYVAFLWLKSRPLDDPEAMRSLSGITTFVDSKWIWTLSHPTFFLFNRAATALIGTVMVALTAVLGGRLALATAPAREASALPGCKAHWAGLVAAALLAGTATHVDLSVFIKPDMLGACLVLASVICAAAYVTHGRSRALLAALTLGALAAAAKYNLVLCLVAALAALAIRSFGPNPRPRRLLRATALLLPPLVFFAAMPYALVDSERFLADVVKEIQHYSVLGQNEHTVEPGWPHFLVQLRFFADNFSVPALLCAVLGVYRARRRPQAWVILSFCVGYALLMLNMRVSFHHNFLALYAFVAVFAALGADHSLSFIRERLGRRAQHCAALLLVAALGLHLAAPARASLTIHNSRETRSLAMDLINELAEERGWQNIAIANELRIHAVDYSRLEVPFEVLSLAEVRRRAGDFDALISATNYHAPPGARPEAVSRAARYNGLTPRETVFGEVPGGPLTMVIRAVNPGVLIVAPKGASAD